MPLLQRVEPASGPSSGGDLVRLLGQGFAASTAVWFGTVAGVVESVTPTQIIVRTPSHAEATVDIALQNLDASGQSIPGERAALVQAYQFLRPRIVREANLTRLIRTLLQQLKRQLMDNVSLSVAVDFDDAAFDGLNVVAIAKVPAIVLSGPQLRENRRLSTNELLEEVVAGPEGPEIRRRRPPLTVDLQFGITGASDRVVELLNMIAAVSAFLNCNRWITVARDADDPAKGEVRWEMDPLGDLQMNLEGKDDIRAFTWGLVIYGFDIDEGLPLDLSTAVSAVGAQVSVRERVR